MGKLKENYESAEIELILLSTADIVTASVTDGAPDSGDVDDWTKT